jgi:ADP-heptose:LPS heptosyltransferase
MNRAPQVTGTEAPGSHRTPHDPSRLFVWQTPFRPVVELAPNATAAGAPDAARSHAIFLGVNLLGDMLCTTPVLRAFRRAHPEAFLTYVTHNAPYCRVLDGNPDVDLVLYRDDLHYQGEAVVSEAWCRRLPLQWREPATLYRLNVHEVCRSHPHVFDDQIAQGFARYVGIPIDSVRPMVTVSDADRRVAHAYAPAPYVVFGLHSTARVVGSDGRLALKEWVLERWLSLAQLVRERWGLEVIAVGAERDVPAPSRHLRSLHALPIKVVAALLEGAACVVAVEGGLTHLCHALDAPMVVIFSRHIAFAWANPREATRCRVVRDDPRAITVGAVLAAMQSLPGFPVRRLS